MPSERFAQADMDAARRLGLSEPRRSVDGTEVVMHKECYDRLFPVSPSDGRRRKRAAYPVYDSEDEAFGELMRSEAWCSEREEDL